LVCTQPDQLLPVIGEYVHLLEELFRTQGLENALKRLPLLVMASNGIYHERVRRFLVESLEESMLYGRLPDLWSKAMGKVVGKLLRGVTIQTGRREGVGADAIYHAGPSARTTLAGGDVLNREKCAKLLRGLGGWFDASNSAPPVRVEFDKALINLWCNLLGQLNAIDVEGRFRLVKIREILDDSDGQEFQKLSHHLISIGRAVRAYGDEETTEQIHDSAILIANGLRDHFPSSLKWIESQLRAGTLTSQLTPTERWLLEPLVHYARTSGLKEAAEYFSLLRQRIEERLGAAMAHQQSS
jgi:hypothetical protein